MPEIAEYSPRAKAALPLHIPTDFSEFTLGNSNRQMNPPFLCLSLSLSLYLSSPLSL